MGEPYQYIVVKDSNQRGVIACQAAHAAGESMALRNGSADWTPSDVNIVLLVAKDSAALEDLGRALEGASLPHVVIREPDPPYNGVATAVGIAPTRDRESVRKHVEHFKVLR